MGKLRRIWACMCSQLRDWVKKFADDPQHVFPGHGQMRGCGLPIISSWIDSEINTTDREVSPQAWAEHWSRCLAEVSSADVVLFYAPEGFTQCGALIEIGAALQAGAQVFVISDYTWTIAHHPQCRVFKSLEDAVIAVKARVQGEEARARARPTP